MKRFNLSVLAAVALTLMISLFSISGAEATASNASKTVCKAVSAPPRVPGTYSMPKVVSGRDSTKITLYTNCGNIVFTAFGKKAPTTVSVFSFLAKKGYFNKTLCHRIVTVGIFVLQCGDPTGTGRGGPGFSFKDENLPKYIANNYPAGTIAMANAGPGTNGSQFFIVYKDTTLPAAYTIWGHVTSGLNIVQAVATKGVSADGMSPAQSIALLKVSIK